MADDRQRSDLLAERVAAAGWTFVGVPEDLSPSDLSWDGPRSMGIDGGAYPWSGLTSNGGVRRSPPTTDGSGARMTASATSPVDDARSRTSGREPRGVVAAVFHAAAAEPDVALLVVEPDKAKEPIILWTNPRTSELLGVASSDLVGEPLAQFVKGPDGVSLSTMLRRERRMTTSGTARTAVGETVACRVSATPAPDGRLWTLQVHHAHSDLELALRASADAHEYRFKVLAERSPVPTMMSEQGMRLGHANDALCALLGVTADKLVGTGWLDHAHRDDLERITQTVVAVLAGQEREIQARFVDADRRIHYTDMRFTPLHTPGAGDGFMATLEDVTERRAFEEQLNFQATHDSLTGLPRRSKLWDHITAAMADPAAGLACMFLDLDNFKMVNDTLGHKAGDALLVEIAHRLTGSLRPGDLVARFGGDEFVVVCGTGSLDAALEVADRIMRVLSDPVVLDGVEIHPRGSIGVVLRGPDHHTADDLIRDCDIAMYQAKSRGKGRIMVLDEGARNAVRESLTLVSDLRQAIDERQITLCYQPIMRYEGSTPVLASVEALARWHHPERGPIPADVFVRLAEEHGLVHDLGELVLDRACEALAEWQHVLGPLAPPRMNVNLSALQMSDYLLVQTVKRTLRRRGLRPDQLCLEITESALMKDPDAASTILTQLREHGVQVAIDDFGTGYSSLAYLRKLPVNYLKVDRSFVAELQDGHTAVAMAVISLAHSLGIGVVAEGVETASQMQILESMDCSLLQGFGLSQPLDEPDFVDWCRSGCPVWEGDTS
ncbi:putative bifunctional diguanylate cyclase/phosphodiesterase [Nocardioides humilatus]|uniref:putative bifunctional diguanylate cyclase/phosphodiesterase n=1 Tax=Nocardioides humilatus TaxID=2607660 RepID=UPI00165FE9CF|nr:EAL domain-containing protein [Nocardioides humilatus]